MALAIALASPIVRWITRPKLKVEAPLRPPGCHLLVVPQGRAYFFRLWIFNDGGRAAENVQVFVDELAHKAYGKIEPDPNFLPMDLRWTHAPEGGSTYLERINAGMGHHCELGSMSEPQPGSKSLMNLTLEHRELHWLGSGAHRLTLKIAGSNAKPVTKVLEVEVSGEWDPDQRVMFEKHVKLTIVE